MNVRELIELLEEIDVNQESEVVIHDDCLLTGVESIGERVVLSVDCYCGYVP